MGVVLGEAADAGQARQLARLLVAVDRAELGQPHRQVAVAPRLGGVDLDVVRAVHRLEQVFLAHAVLLDVADPPGRVERPVVSKHGVGDRLGSDVGARASARGCPPCRAGRFWAASSSVAVLQAVDQRHGRRRRAAGGRELRILVIRIVAAGLVELDLADVRGVDRLIAALDQLVLQEVLEDAADDRPLGHPEDQARADQGRDREQVQLLAELAVVALLRLLDLGEVGVELLLVEEGGAVDALEHLAGRSGPSSRRRRSRAA